jgi:hypothetical protein
VSAMLAQWCTHVMRSKLEPASPSTLRGCRSCLGKLIAIKPDFFALIWGTGPSCSAAALHSPGLFFF